jgi:hypothetical protein
VETGTKQNVKTLSVTPRLCACISLVSVTVTFRDHPEVRGVTAFYLQFV